MAKHHIDRKWNSLSELRDHIDMNVDDENVVSFDGFELVTDIFRYRLFDSQLTILDLEEENV